MGFWDKNYKGLSKVDYGMDLFRNLSLSNKAERQERDHARLQQFFANQSNQLLATRLYRSQLPFTIENFEKALQQLDDKNLTQSYSRRDVKLIHNWLMVNLHTLYQQRERDRDENWQIH